MSSITEENDAVDCPYCAEVILRRAIRCKHCGADLQGGGPQARGAGSSDSGKKGVPAVLSLFVPGLGQIVKGQWLKAFAIYCFALVSLVGCVLLDWTEDPFVFHGVLDPQLANAIPWTIFVVLIVGAWLYSVVDAYNA